MFWQAGEDGTFQQVWHIQENGIFSWQTISQNHHSVVNKCLLRIFLQMITGCQIIVSAEAGMPVLAPPGIELARILPRDELSLFQSWNGVSDFAVSDDKVAFMTQNREIVVLNSANGSEKLRAAAPVSGTFSYAHLQFEGDTLYLAEAQDAMTSGYAKNTLSALDPETGIWKWTRSSIVRHDNATFQCQIQVSVYNDEIRATYSGYESRYESSWGDHITRWKLSDLSPLSPIYFDSRKKSAGPPLSTAIGIPMGRVFCAGYTYGEISKSGGKTGLVMESDGQASVSPFPDGIYPLEPISGRSGLIGHAESLNYLILTTKKDYAGDQTGFLIKQRKNLNSVPVFIPLPSKSQAPYFRIWKDRFLLVVSINQANPQTEAPLLSVFDLAHPDQSPVKIRLPMGTPVPVAMGVSGKDIWFYSSTRDAASKDSIYYGRIENVASDTMATVYVEDTSSAESEGILKFRIHADRPLKENVTVKLKSLSATAVDGVDYTGIARTITLTPRKPEAEIVVPLIQDSIIETFESMILEVTDVSGAWRGNRYANGIIRGSGFPEISRIQAPPGAKSSYAFTNWAMTSSGVVAGSKISNQYGYLLLRHGDTAWKPIVSLGRHNLGSNRSSRIVGVNGNRLGIIIPDADSTNFQASKLIIADIDKEKVLSEIHDFSGKIAIKDSGFVTLSQGWDLSGYVFGSDSRIWTKNSWADLNGIHMSSIVAFDGENFLHDGNMNEGTLRSFSTGEFVSATPLTPGGALYVHDAKNGIWMGTNDTHAIICNTTPHGHRAVFSGTAYQSAYFGFLTQNSLRISESASSSVPVMEVMDCKSGAKVSSMPGRGTDTMAVSDDHFAILTGNNELTVYQSVPTLPGPALLTETREEDDTNRGWVFRLAEKAPFPLTVRVISTEDIEATPPAIIPTGGTTATFPARVVVDGIPENKETISLAVVITGNSTTETHRVQVTIPANQHVTLPEPKKANLIAGASSVALHPSGIVVGSVPGAIAVDPRYKGEHKAPKTGAEFGYSVACNKTHMAVGAPDLVKPRNGTGQVILYDRKKGSTVKTLREKHAGSAFGAVLHMNDQRLFIGAPGFSGESSVTACDLSSDKTRVLHPPGSAGTESRFGAAISSAGNQVFIGAPKAGSGKVYQFNSSTGKLVRTLSSPGDGYSNFGTSITVTGSRVFVGAPSKDSSALFVFNANSGSHTGTLPSPFSDGGNYGVAMTAPDRNILAVGCPTSLFSPEGGIMLYDCRSKTPRLITMLRPAPGRGPNGGGFLRGMGVAGGLSGADSILGVALRTGISPSDILSYQPIASAIPKVGIIDLSPYLPSRITASKNSSILPANTTENVWESALGPGADLVTCTMDIDGGNQIVRIHLPEIATLERGATLTIEHSDNLETWETLAVMKSSNTGLWQPIGQAFVDANSQTITLPMTRKRFFLRTRCDLQ